MHEGQEGHRTEITDFDKISLCRLALFGYNCTGSDCSVLTKNYSKTKIRHPVNIMDMKDIAHCMLTFSTEHILEGIQSAISKVPLFQVFFTFDMFESNVKQLFSQENFSLTD